MIASRHPISVEILRQLTPPYFLARWWGRVLDLVRYLDSYGFMNYYKSKKNICPKCGADRVSGVPCDTCKGGLFIPTHPFIKFFQDYAMTAVGGAILILGFAIILFVLMAILEKL